MSASTSVKKPIARRARQKRDILDDEDLKKQQQLEKNILQGRVKQEGGDIFDTAKLDKNYFVRQENKSAHVDSQIFSFDDYEEQTTESNNTKSSNQITIPTKEILERQDSYKQIQENQSQIRKKQQKKSMMVSKRREQRKKQRNQNIFDEEEQENEQQEEYMPKREQNQQHQPTKKQANLQKIQKTYQIQQNQHYQPKTNTIDKQPFSDFDNQEVISQRGKGNSDVKQGDSDDNNQDVKQGDSDQDENRKQNDEDQFDNAIKQQQQKSQEQEKHYILHIELAKLSNKQDRKRFYYQTLPPNYVAYAYFKRFTSGLSQVYQLCGEDHRPLLFCENQRGCIGANYYISMTKEMNKNNQSYLGKLRGNASGSIYSLYDHGIQPKNQINRSDWRVSMAAIEYESNFMGMNGPRKIKVTTPCADLIQQDVDMYKFSEQESLLNFKPPVITQFRNKTPKWNERLKSYALNFGGRVKLASIKNFILIDNQYSMEEEQDAENVIVFGKVDQTTFSLEYRYPLSLYQAFGIVMSEFDFKINCE